jgi:hypothetical protein
LRARAGALAFRLQRARRTGILFSMVPWISRVVRETFRRERISPRLRWWFAAEGMAEWFRLLRDELAPHLGGRDAAASILAALAGPMFARRHDVFRAMTRGLPDRAGEPRAVGLTMGALYRVASNPGAEWIFAACGGAPATFAEHALAERWLAGAPLEARWVEVTHHLGELLIALTEGLPAHMPRARGVLGDLCFAAGERVGRKMKKAFSLRDTPEDAMEVLRMSEYVFRVNQEHWAGTGERTGFLEGSACPWFTAPGWSGAHCGIFGQFQSGITSVFGLRYQLTTTIPRHGGHTCRIDVRPIELRRGKDGAAALVR